MTATTGSATKIAEAYVRAWMTGDVETAMTYIADDITCEAPSGPISGRDGYRRFLAPFASSLDGGQLTDVLGDDVHAAAVYIVDTPFAKDFRGMEYLTVENGKITRAVTLFDRAPIIAAQAASQG